ncbi:MAG: hypothetical protein VX614_06625 [Myxococcota bacterium]|nr:hypothetical protein [Myxococcota bacterium]
MSQSEVEALLRSLRAHSVPDGTEVIKRNRVRSVVRAGERLLKLFHERPQNALREARALREAERRGLCVPHLLDSGPDWLATRWIAGRPAERRDLEQILASVAAMHAAGMLHGDLHLANLRIGAGKLWITDLQRSRFFPWLPRMLQNRELGWLAASLGEPLPAELERVQFWCALRRQRHWRSRTRRCLIESGSFTRFTAQGLHGFRRREVDAPALLRALDENAEATRIKHTQDRRVERRGAWIVKEHASAGSARRAWVAGCGLEARGIATGRSVAWVGRWLVMEDAGEPLSAFVEHNFSGTTPHEREEMADCLATLVGTLHRRGIYHADLKAGNLCWAPGTPPRLVDYGQVRFGRHVSSRRRIRNLAQLNASLPDPVPGGLRERALERYLGETGEPRNRRRFRARIIRESLRRNHRWSGC